MPVVVTKLIVATIIAALAVGVIVGSHSSNPKPSQIVRTGRFDEADQHDPLMNCADASYACPSGLFIAPQQTVASYTIKERWGDFERSLIGDPLGMLIALEGYGQTRHVHNMAQTYGDGEVKRLAGGEGTAIVGHPLDGAWASPRVDSVLDPMIPPIVRKLDVTISAAPGAAIIRDIPALSMC
jgi:hypothetical protein